MEEPPPRPSTISQPAAFACSTQANNTDSGGSATTSSKTLIPNPAFSSEASAWLRTPALCRPLSVTIRILRSENRSPRISPRRLAALHSTSIEPTVSNENGLISVVIIPPLSLSPAPRSLTSSPAHNAGLIPEKLLSWEGSASVIFRYSRCIGGSEEKSGRNFSLVQYIEQCSKLNNRYRIRSRTVNFSRRPRWWNQCLKVRGRNIWKFNFLKMFT